MQSTEKQIVTKISKRGRGTIFFNTDFCKIAEPKTISKALERLKHSGTIIKIARGIYCYPKIDNVYGIGILHPSPDEIAEKIARRDKARIAPTGNHALNILGLSTQVPMRIVYLTDGKARNIRLDNGNIIEFKHTSTRKLAFTNKTAMLITYALSELKQEHIEQWHLDKIKHLLAKEPQKLILNDLPLMPGWIRTIIKKCYEQK